MPNLISCSEQSATSTAKLCTSHIRNKFHNGGKGVARPSELAAAVRKTQTEKKKNSESRTYLDRDAHAGEGINKAIEKWNEARRFIDDRGRELAPGMNNYNPVASCGESTAETEMSPGLGLKKLLPGHRVRDHDFFGRN